MGVWANKGGPRAVWLGGSGGRGRNVRGSVAALLSLAWGIGMVCPTYGVMVMPPTAEGLEMRTRLHQRGDRDATLDLLARWEGGGVLPWRFMQLGHLVDGGLTADERATLLAAFSRSKRYLEYGAGESTLLAAKFPALSVVSVESLWEWREMIASIIRKPHLHNDTAAASAVPGAPGHVFKLTYVNIGGEGAMWSIPKDRSMEANWPKYVDANGLVNAFSPDLVLVDGRFRVACALNVLPVLAANGGTLLVHDYPERDYFHVIEDFYDRVAVHDRLGVFQPKAQWNHTLLTQAAVQYLADWR
jgi:hypothetical protein